MRAYSKHEANYIFRIKELDLGSVAEGFGLLRMPGGPEVRAWRKRMEEEEEKKQKKKKKKEGGEAEEGKMEGVEGEVKADDVVDVKQAEVGEEKMEDGPKTEAENEEKEKEEEEEEEDEDDDAAQTNRVWKDAELDVRLVSLNSCILICLLLKI